MTVRDSPLFWVLTGGRLADDWRTKKLPAAATTPPALTSTRVDNRVAPVGETGGVAAPPLDSEPTDLEALVGHELRGPVSQLVRKLIPELVAEELNGYPTAGAGTTAAGPEGAEETPGGGRASSGGGRGYARRSRGG